MQNEQGLVPLGGTTTTRLRDRRTVRGNARVSAGFSLVELMIVLAIALVVSAFAIPTLTTTMDGIRLRGSTGSATNIAQRCRMQAAKRNLYQRLHFATVNNRVVLFVTDGADAAVAPLTTDNTLWAQLWFPSQFSIPGVPTGAGAPPQLTSAQMWGTATAPNVNIDPYFNARGLPCLPNAGGICTTTTGFVYYYRYRSGGRTRWAANSISPAGRIQSWIWNGNAWGN
jgi:prepilin-type N-terminal cleavage/methylation domain-containing protein